MKVLITGGAGFVGSHTADALLERGHSVRVFDNLDPQVHGENPEIPDYLHPEVEFVRGDVRDREELKAAIAGMDVIYHLAAAVGVGQSMYEVQKYVEINSLGGAVLLDILANEDHNVSKLIVASSMSIYGEGQYHCHDCGIVFPKLRSASQLENKDWEMHCPDCDAIVDPMPTNEEKPLFPTSIYAISKRDHEEMFLTIGRAYDIPTVALRYFNIYGSRQALSNPYTGVEANYEVFNVGTGRKLTILDMGNVLSERLAPELNLTVLGQFREGDIRHCYADINKIQTKLDFSPKVAFEDGIDELVDWVSTQQANDMVENAKSQLLERNLVR